MVYKLLSTLGPKKKIQYNQNLLVSLSFGGHGPHNIGIIRYTHTHTHTHSSFNLVNILTQAYSFLKGLGYLIHTS